MSNDEYEQSTKKKLDVVMKIAGALVESAAKKLPGAGEDKIKVEALRIYKDFLKNTEASYSQEQTEAVIMAIGIAAKKARTDGKQEMSMPDKCNSCGAEIEYTVGSQSLKCPYCGAINEIQKAENKLPIVVEKIIPLMVSQDDLKKRAYGYMASGNYTPDDMLEAATFTKHECFYVPAFLFRIEYEATWTASFGYDRTEHYTEYVSVTKHSGNRSYEVQEPRTRTKTVTDWRPENGVDAGIVSVSTYAGKVLRDSALSPSDIIPFTIVKGGITNFNSSFMKGVQAESFVVPETSAFSSLKDEINSSIDHKVRSHGQGDHQKDWHWNAKMSHSTHTLYVPICHAVFDYQGTEYHVWIDGIGEAEIRADKLPEDKGRKKLIYLGFIPAGVAIIGIAVGGGLSLFAAVLLGGYAAIRRKSIIGYSKKIRDSLLTQIHASSSATKEMTSEERDKLAQSFQRPEKPFFAKTHKDKIVLPVLSLLALMPALIGLIFPNGTADTNNLKKTQQAVAVAAPAPVPTPPVIVQPDTPADVPSVEWVKVGENKEGEQTFYVNPSTIRKTDNKATMWSLIDFKIAQINPNASKPSLSLREQYEFDCKENHERSLNIFSFYSGKMNSGDVTLTNSASSPVPAEWSPVTPGSVGEDMWKIACGQTAHVPADVEASQQATWMPGFDCTKASTFTEKTICSDSLLGKLDGALSENYKYMLASDIGDRVRNDLKTTQNIWLAERNKCTDNQCLVTTYRKRMNEVCEYPVISGVHPICTSSDDIK